MQKLRGTGTTFSTSGKRWQPFMLNPKVAKRNAKLHRLLKSGKLKPMSKEEMRQACIAAVKPQQ
jgi:hypothetical protein